MNIVTFDAIKFREKVHRINKITYITDENIILRVDEINSDIPDTI